jgi:hypothetical protein
MTIMTRVTMPIAMPAALVTLVLACGSSSSGDGSGGFPASGPVFSTGPTARPDSGCTPDMRATVGDNGQVKEVCAAGQACLRGLCIDACKAAAGTTGSVGCDFMAVTPAFYPDIAPPCFATFVTNNSLGAAQVKVSRAGATLDPGQFGRLAKSGLAPAAWPPIPADGIPPNEVGVLFLSADPTSTHPARGSLACPVPTAIPAGTAVAGSGRGRAFHIETTMPVGVYDILPFGGASSVLPSAQIVYPTSAWGQNYVAAVPPLGKDIFSGFPPGPQWGIVVAAEDGTSVTVKASSLLAGGSGVGPAQQGAPTTYTLAAGEYIQWEPAGEMSGTVVSSDKPVAFVGGSGYLCLQSSTAPMGGGCDSAHQMIPQVKALGSDYGAAPYATRRATLEDEAVLYRIVAAVDGTNLTFDPPVAGTPPSLHVGQVADFEATGAFRVKSQDGDHPFFLAQMMTGAIVNGGSRPGATPGLGGRTDLGDEEFVQVLPPAQYLPHYVFFTDPTYATTNVTVTRVKGQDGTFRDVTIGCSGAVTGWKPIGTSGDFEYANVDLVRGNAGVNGCTNGPQKAESGGLFGLTVWGLDAFASYAYPAGGLQLPINQVVLPVQ